MAKVANGRAPVISYCFVAIFPLPHTRAQEEGVNSRKAGGLLDASQDGGDGEGVKAVVNEASEHTHWIVCVEEGGEDEGRWLLARLTSLLSCRLCLSRHSSGERVLQPANPCHTHTNWSRSTSHVTLRKTPRHSHSLPTPLSRRFLCGVMIASPLRHSMCWRSQHSQPPRVYSLQCCI